VSKLSAPAEWLDSLTLVVPPDSVELSKRWQAIVDCVPDDLDALRAGLAKLGLRPDWLADPACSAKVADVLVEKARAFPETGWHPARRSVQTLLRRLGDAHDRLYAADFGLAGVRYLDVNPTRVSNYAEPLPLPGGVHRVVLGLVDHLADGHMGRTLMPLSDLYQSDSGPTLVLGKVLRGQHPVSPDFFLVDEVVAHTRAWRSGQLREERLQHEAEERRRAEDDARERERRRFNDPLTASRVALERIALLEAELAGLKENR
jgi:hypothetical protein